MRKAAATLITTFGLLLAPALIGQVKPTPRPCAAAIPCGVPEPSAVPELALCLAGIGIGYWLWRQNRKPV